MITKICKKCGEIIDIINQDKCCDIKLTDICSVCALSDKDNKLIHNQAIQFRNKKRIEWIDGKIGDEDFWLIKTMEEMSDGE